VMTLVQITSARAILNIFETSSVLGEYGAVTVIPGDKGHLTFGPSQTTLGSGNLADLIDRYVNSAGARFAQRLRPWLGRLRERDESLNDELHLHNILRATADDRVKRDVQDEFFDQVYWQPAERTTQRLGLITPLGTAVVYDGTLHGSWDKMRRRTDEQAGTVAALGERAWVEAYVQVRRDWLANHPRRDLPPQSTAWMRFNGSSAWASGARSCRSSFAVTRFPNSRSKPHPEAGATGPSPVRDPGSQAPP
jgi:chitosanase